MAEYLEYDVTMDAIPEQDSPEEGMVFIVPTWVIGKTWTVARWGNERRGHEPLGIIYTIENARKFAMAV